MLNNLRQAPTLINPRGSATTKHKDKQFYSLPIGLTAIICNELSGKAGNQLKLMLLLIGSQDTSGGIKKAFAISEGLVKSRLGMSQTRYVEARNALKERGWIEHKDGYIKVLYDNIYPADDIPEMNFDTVSVSNSEDKFEF